MLASVPDLLVSLQTGMFHNMELCVLQNVQHVCVWKIRMKLRRECRTHMWMRLKSGSCCSLHGRHFHVKKWRGCVCQIATGLYAEEGKHQPRVSNYCSLCHDREMSVWRWIFTYPKALMFRKTPQSHNSPSPGPVQKQNEHYYMSLWRFYVRNLS